MRMIQRISLLLLICSIFFASVGLLTAVRYGNKVKIFGISHLERITFEILGPPAYKPKRTVIATIPEQDAWTNQGIVLSAGPTGSWDVRLNGMFNPCAALNKDGTYFLYYIGADGDRSTDGGPRHRALGVATSNDGINFTKYNGNPIITYLPHNNEEEGIFSCGATLDDTGNVVLYYGALRAPNSTSQSVDIDIRMQTSSDGRSFTGDKLIRQVSGSELTPIGAIHDQDSWYVYYRGPLSGGRGPLQLLSGDSPDNLPNNELVLSNKGVGGDAIWLDSENIALFLSIYDRQRTIEVRAAPASNPQQISAPVEEYNFGSEWKHQATLFDRETETWFMYQQLDGGIDIYVRTAPPTSTPLPPEYDECVFLPTI